MIQHIEIEGKLLITLRKLVAAGFTIISHCAISWIEELDFETNKKCFGWSIVYEDNVKNVN